MGAGNFFAGLLGGYTGTVVRNESRAYNQEMQARELDVNAALKALDEAVKTGDQGAMQAAAANFQRSVNAIREPFHTGLGGGKGKGKKQSQQDPLVSSILQGMIQHGTKQAQPGGPSALPAMPTIPGQGARPGYDPGMTFGQPAQSAGLAPVPVMASRNAPQAPTGISPVPQAQSPAPQTGNQPAQPQAGLPALPTLSSALGALPNSVTQATTQGKALGAQINAMSDTVSDWEAKQGITVTPQDRVNIQQHLAGIMPKLNADGWHVFTGSATPGDTLPPGATDVDGNPIGEDGRKSDVFWAQAWKPDGTKAYFRVKSPSTGSAGQDKVNLVNGVPSSVHYQGKTYATDDPNMPEGGRALLQAATQAHIKSRNEKQQDAILRDNLMMKRMRYGALDLTDTKEARKVIRKDIVDYQDAQRRLGIMEKNLPAALKGNQQAMVAILYNHVGMTALAQKGARQTRALIEEAEKSRPWLQAITSRVQNGEPVSGIALSPDQMKFMVNLAVEVEQNMRDSVESSAQEMFGDNWKSQMKDVAPGFFNRKFVKAPESAGGTAAATGPKPKTADEYLKSIGAK